ncbi:unnamed protein product [Phytomonas sp. EM1]|nr:unnamed protein product [Phytomonas sp. EM1]|eukprot:CCW59983.1 unnamed protein product [Phytomonas sp. isolate EM1]
MRFFIVNFFKPESSSRLKCVFIRTNSIQRFLHIQSSTTRKDGGGSTTSASPSGENIKRPSKEQPAYYNFSTSIQLDTQLRRHRRLSLSFPTDRTSLENGSLANESDPHKHLHARRDIIEASSSRSTPLSIDVPMRKFLDMFCDFDAKRCKLCNETILNWHSHQNSIPHSGREALLLEMVRAYCGTPEEITQIWWHRLHTSDAFERIPALSHNNSHVRKRRLQYLLRFLTDRGIIRDAFNVLSGNSGAGRSWEFERLEWLGDNVVKYVFNNRFNCIFPVSEGGIRGKLGYSQFILDGNDGLARAYDYLELQQLTQSDRVVSKFKSDVVETLFGELEVYLWSTELDLGTTRHSMPFGKDMYAVRSLVRHTMEELAHVMVMYHVEYLLSVLRRIMRENQLQLVRADPSLRGQNEAVQELSGSLYHSKKAATVPYSRFTAQKIYHNHQLTASLYNESTNYDKFRRVPPLGGLEPSPFPRSTASPNYLPHLQIATKLSERLNPLWHQGPYFCLAAKDATSGDGTVNRSKSDTTQQVTTRETSYRLQEAPIQWGGKPVTLNLSTLIDENLITELI